ncbi:MAG TPA: caspase family protein, partial [Gemmatimonadaceae bacterium]|nr:caspase family protein [Gemmatimonadaceae bacterium]
MTMPEAASARVRRALVIGINAYTRRPLDGCVADAELMARILRERFAFAEADITLLRNREASREAVLSELDALVDATNADDTAFIFYAGHGALAKNEDSSEASGYDNTLNVCDDPREDIYDHEIEARLQAL